mmetsp:Transcript_18855/g.44724  ORF Transcript_18855/g.44724 Transcript_18855/m.44724 type:complete len:85 (+) Transcript_18855:40-294(+)
MTFIAVKFNVKKNQRNIIKTHSKKNNLNNLNCSLENKFFSTRKKIIELFTIGAGLILAPSSSKAAPKKIGKLGKNKPSGRYCPF